MRCFRADQVWTGSQLLTGVDVIVDGTDIVAIGPAEETAGEAQLIDLAGHTLLPGLIDAHVHLGFDSQVDPITQHRATSAPYLALRMAENARKLVSCGVTTARDLGAPDFADIALRDAITAGITVGPNLLAATRPVTPTGGHCWYLGGQADTPAELRRVAQQNLRAGADWLKIMASGGQMTPAGPPSWQRQYSTEEIADVVTQARMRGKRVAAHAHSPDAIQAALDAKVDSIEHCSFTTSQGSRFDPAVAEAIAAADITVCSTVSGLFWRMRDILGARQMDGQLERLRSLRSAGVRLMTGTDCGFAYRGLDNAADLFVTALEVIAHAGFSTHEVLRMATVDAATGCGIGEVTGSVQTGKRADLIAVAGDPLRDLSALRQLGAVVVNGRMVTQNGVDTVAASSDIVG